jgi:hypothetical protein
MPFITNDHFSTADFCAFGPTPPPDLSVALGPSPPDRNPLSMVGKIATVGVSLGLAARDRVFGAYCELTPEPSDVGWSDWVCSTFTSPAPFRVDGLTQVPAGASKFRARVTNLGGGGMPPGQLNGYDWPATIVSNYGTWSAASGVVLEDFVKAAPYNAGIGIEWANTGTHVTECYSFYGAGLGAATPYVPDPQPLPAGVLSPLRTVPPTLDGIAYEAQLLELKLDTMLAIIQSIAGATLDLGGPVDDAVDFPADTPLDVGTAVGAVITATGIPASRALDFGDPQNLVRLGHVNCGTATAWYPSIWLTHTPMVLRPFPPGTTRVTVTDLPPGCTCTIALISRTK